MTYRGPILIVFALSLVASPFAIRLAQEDAPREAGILTTMGDAQSDCDSRTFAAKTYVIGCGSIANANPHRQRMSGGGALFVAVSR